MESESPKGIHPYIYDLRNIFFGIPIFKVRTKKFAWHPLHVSSLFLYEVTSEILSRNLNAIHHVRAHGDFHLEMQICIVCHSALLLRKMTGRPFSEQGPRGMHCMSPKCRTSIEKQLRGAPCHQRM